MYSESCQYFFYWPFCGDGGVLFDVCMVLWRKTTELLLVSPCFMLVLLQVVLLANRIMVFRE